jgi:hypothetical protein
MPKVEAWLNEKVAAGKNNKCTMDNVVVRREWLVGYLWRNSLRRLTNLIGATCPMNREKNTLQP